MTRGMSFKPGDQVEIVNDDGAMSPGIEKGRVYTVRSYHPKADAVQMTTGLMIKAGRLALILPEPVYTRSRVMAAVAAFLEALETSA
jgi:hypothetical protein